MQQLVKQLAAAEAEVVAIITSSELGILAAATHPLRARPEPAPEQASEDRAAGSAGSAQTNSDAGVAPAMGKLLLGWKPILDELELPNKRKHQVQIRRLNERRFGPITWVDRKPTVFSAALTRWIIDVRGTPAARAAQDDGSTTAPDVELNHPAELKELGYQTKVRPNNQGSVARLSGYEP